MHNSYVSEGIDGKKMEAEAYQRAQGDSRSKPEATTIHYHRYGGMCLDREHKVVEPKHEETEA